MSPPGYILLVFHDHHQGGMGSRFALEMRRPAQAHTQCFVFVLFVSLPFPRAGLGIVLLAMMIAELCSIPEVGFEPTISYLGGRHLIH